MTNFLIISLAQTVLFGLLSLMPESPATEFRTHESNTSAAANALTNSFAHSGQQDVNEDELAIAILRLIKASRNGFSDLKAGVGQKLDDGSLTYECAMSLPGASKTTISIIPDTTPYVGGNYYSGKDENKAKATYEALRPKLTRILSNWQSNEHEKSSSLDTSRYLDFTSQAREDSPRVSLGYICYNQSRNCRVSITIWSPESLSLPKK